MSFCECPVSVWIFGISISIIEYCNWAGSRKDFDYGQFYGAKFTFSFMKHLTSESGLWIKGWAFASNHPFKLEPDTTRSEVSTEISAVPPSVLHDSVLGPNLWPIHVHYLYFWELRLNKLNRVVLTFIRCPVLKLPDKFYHIDLLIAISTFFLYMSIFSYKMKLM